MDIFLDPNLRKKRRFSDYYKKPDIEEGEETTNRNDEKAGNPDGFTDEDGEVDKGDEVHGRGLAEEESESDEGDEVDKGRDSDEEYQADVFDMELDSGDEASLPVRPLTFSRGVQIDVPGKGTDTASYQVESGTQTDELQKHQYRDSYCQTDDNATSNAVGTEGAPGDRGNWHLFSACIFDIGTWVTNSIYV